MRELKTFYLRTYGCQMNELDSEIMSGILTKRGLVPTEDEEIADILIFNTCSIRDLAERKVMGKLGQLGRGKKRGRVIGVTGCMANAKKETLFRKLPHIDFILGTNNIHDLDTVLDEVLQTQQQTLRTDDIFSQELDYAGAKRQDPYKAFVSIIRGCDKYCTYCVVPYTRGPESSRSLASILEECRQLVDKGYKEITLLGQNVNSYGKDHAEWNVRFHDLLYALDKIPDLHRVRFLTSHPVDITRELMEAMRDLDSLCEHVHFPLQAGSDRILRKMHRMYTREQYMEKVAILKELVPNVVLGTDMIIGFPTETEEEFEQTYQAMKEVRYGHAFLYTYSPRKGTPAMRWVDDIPEEVKQARHQRVLALHDEISNELMQQMLGQTVEVLVERKNRDQQNLKGLTRCWRNVIFPGDASLIGTLQKVHLHSYSHSTFIGSIVDQATIETFSLEQPKPLKII
ncbi:MAG: tRNA (N6-isopentenyl adenosine(37)-C2)-methylthiotransferase MiaB [Verrucomicrobia bacterium]|nr:tRNA (N6-isopentenyl adenosine(37)-C2)-methylthiotransferase MiaB [Verrucomicrobiota bacterium]